MNFNSIKWRLQIWYALLLCLMLAGLVAAAYNLERDKLFRQIDNELKDRVRTLAFTIDRPPGMDEPRPSQRRPFQLQPQDEALFSTNTPRQFYFRIVDGDDREIVRSKNFENGPMAKREITILTPSENHITAGCVIDSDLAELRHSIVRLAAVGGFMLLLGLGIGGWFISRALRPISDISLAAERIAAGDLTQRIDAAETKSELGRLTAVLNSTFERLEAAFAVQKRFAADAAHELRTPVSVLIAQTHAALMRKRSYEDNLQTIEACHRAAQRMRLLIVSLLQIAQLDAGKEKAKRITFDLLPVVSECVELIKPLAEERDVKIFLEAGTAEIFGNPEQIHQVITNLATNAIQYNKPGGEMRLKLSAEAGQVVMTVTDTGIGISNKHLPHIFDRFYRADPSRSSGNAGLGLSICQAIVEAHGGTIEVASQENVRTVFTLRFPAK